MDFGSDDLGELNQMYFQNFSRLNLLKQWSSVFEMMMIWDRNYVDLLSSSEVIFGPFVLLNQRLVLYSDFVMSTILEIY